MTPISSQKFFLSHKTWPLINFDGKQSFAILIASQTPEKPLQKANETIANFCILNIFLFLHFFNNLDGIYMNVSFSEHLFLKTSCKISTGIKSYITITTHYK